MAGQTNSWVGSLTDQQQPCLNQSPLSSSAILWFIAGLLVGSLTFEKKVKRDSH